MTILGTTCGMLHADNTYTRGIGQYPGVLNQHTAPTMVKDMTYRNIALNRMVITSSNADFNLTGQLVTDGFVSKTQPATLKVITNEGVASNRDKEKLIDGNIHTDMVLRGEKAFVEYHWTSMNITLENIRLVGEVAYDDNKATGKYAIRILGSKDGKTWKEVGAAMGNHLPGFASKQFVSSDPNKYQDAAKLPLRMVKMNIPLKKKQTFEHLRIEFNMPGAAYWRVYQIDHGEMLPGQEHFSMDNLKWNVSNTAWLPSEHFSSMWMSDNNPTQWLYVDLGTEASFDKINLHWLHKAQAGKIQVSNNKQQWTDIAEIKPGKALSETIACKGKGRYVRLWLTQPDASGHYALSEMEIMGQGGVHAEAANSLPSANGKLMLNQWQVKREGSDQWIEATVPGTVLTSYINVGAVPDNRFADNMRQISESFFNANFVYRTTINHHQSGNKAQHTYLNFDGINWKAEVSLNGEKIGRIEGAFKRACFDVTNKLHEGDNLLEVRVIKNAHYGAVKQKNIESTDKNGGVLGADTPTFHASIGWDWITSTPGREIGIWNDVYLTHDGGVSVSDPLVTTTLNQPDTLATICPSVFVQNADNRDKKVKVVGRVGEIEFETVVSLKALEKREVTFMPHDYAQLRNQPLRLWWPNGYGEPYLYDASYTVLDAETSAVLSSIKYKAGIREMSYDKLDTRTTIFINGKRLNPLGGNWGFAETNLNYRGREYDVAVRYHRDMHYNMIRNWVGQIGDEEFYEACDKYGIMVWQDFWLANPWDGPDPDDNEMFLNNSADYISRIRNHACIGIYVGRNEGFPPEALDKGLRTQIKQLHPQLGYIPSSADAGVSGHGPYRMQSAEYYFSHQTKKLHSERGMPNVPTYESLCRMLNKEQLWPMSDAWGQHDYTLKGAQGGESFNAIMEKHFGKPKSAEQFTKWAQWLNYDGYRAMYESAQQHRMGLLIWMSHSCWPSMVWCTYDYYFEPTAAYFGVKKACEPLHIQYNPVSKQVEIVNSAKGAQKQLSAKLQVLNMWGKVLSEDSKTIDVPEDETIEVLPVQIPNEKVYYIRLMLQDGEKVVSENFYVEGAETDNLLALQALPKATIKADVSAFKRMGDEWVGKVTISNASETPALMIRLNLKGEDGEQILPVIYSDNYLNLMPGENRTINISYRHEDSRGVKPKVEVTSLNE